MSQSRLAVEGSLQAFFFSQVGDAQARCGARLSREVEAYVVHLLADYARRPAVAGRRAGPLALQYLSARQTEGSARAQALRQVGDRALFIAGVVPHSLDRTPVDLRYVRSLGATAYRQVSDGHGALAVFVDLADRFEAAAEVISEATDPRGEGDRDLLGLYERWRRYGEPRDARRLVAAGVALDRDETDTLQ
jgi:hypothetical protein